MKINHYFILKKVTNNKIIVIFVKIYGYSSLNLLF